MLAHLFINHMLESEVAKQNFAATGYQPPQVSIDPDSLVADGIIPKNLAAAIVKPSTSMWATACWSWTPRMMRPGTKSGGRSRLGEPDG